ncbi:MAG: insulinase family protein [Cryobacterium sp.]|nr:insulinase family protein [Oligoflexia bacterium]
MKKSIVRRLFALSLIAFALLSSCASTSDLEKNSQKVPFFGTMEVSRFTLPNGLKLLVLEDASSPTFAYQTWFRVGSRDEDVSYTGLAHLFEHLMFKGTKGSPEGIFDRTLERAGAEGENAFTSRDYTAYVQELPKDKLELIAKLESDRMVNLVVNDKSFKMEREVVQNERRMRNENSPDGLMYQEIFGVVFKQHSYRWPVIGYEEDLNRMSSLDAEKFYSSHYSPNHATIVVVGDVKAADVLKTVTKYYGKLAAKTLPEKNIPVEPEQSAPRRKILKLNTQVQKLMVAYPVPSVVHEDIPALEVLRTVLTGGKSSRLYKALVDSGVATSADTYDLDDKDPSILIFMANLQSGKKASAAEDILLKELEKFKREPISQLELDRAKNVLQAQFFESLSSASEKANFLGHYETVSESFRTGADIFNRIGSVTATQIQAAAIKYLNPSSRNVVMGVQK